MKTRLLFLIVLISQPLLAEPEFVHCYDFGCKSQQTIKYSPEQWDQIQGIFQSGPLDPAGEKQSIRKAIALMEDFSGEITGTALDKGENYPGYDIDYQQDCIDESTNTFQYLSALETLDLLKWHRVAPKKRRIVWFLTHWTAVSPKMMADSYLPSIHGIEITATRLIFKNSKTGKIKRTFRMNIIPTK